MEDHINITIQSDEKGYYDRECPNENCLYRFKIKLDDWLEKVSDDEVHCPMCGHIDISDKWYTQEQLDQMEEIVSSYAMSYIQKALDDTFGDLARKTRNNKYFKVIYKPGRRITFINNPVGQSEEWEQEITCDVCGTTYSVIGSAYFCPCCGHNSASGAFEESLDVIEKMLDSVDDMKSLLSKQYGLDKADTICRQMVESSIGDCISAFQKFAACRYTELTGNNARVNDFQIVKKGSDLFCAACGKGYNSWLSDAELRTLGIYFQRRHVIEHNNGMVDKQYIDKSGDTDYLEGQRLIVRKADTLELIRLIRKIASGFMSESGNP